MEIEKIRQNCEKGDYITTEELNRVYGKELTWFEKLGIWGQFCREYRDKGITVITDMGGIRFLTDSEAVIYNSNKADYGVRKIEDALFMLRRIDNNNLSDHEKKTLERKVVLNSMRVASLMEVSKRASVELKSSAMKEIQ